MANARSIPANQLKCRQCRGPKPCASQHEPPTRKVHSARRRASSSARSSSSLRRCRSPLAKASTPPLPTGASARERGFSCGLKSKLPYTSASLAARLAASRAASSPASRSYRSWERGQVEQPQPLGLLRVRHRLMPLPQCVGSGGLLAAS